MGIFRRGTFGKKRMRINRDMLVDLVMTVQDLMQTPLEMEERAGHIADSIILFLQEGVYEIRKDMPEL
jgi:hypothetical protein